MSLGRSIWAVLFDIFLSLVADLIGSRKKKSGKNSKTFLQRGAHCPQVEKRKDLH